MSDSTISMNFSIDRDGEFPARKALVLLSEGRTICTRSKQIGFL
jgi:hypothetical protein